MASTYNPEQYRRYGIPYGSLGLACDIFSMYMFIMIVLVGRSPLLFRKLRHEKWAPWFLFITACSQTVLLIYNAHITSPSGVKYSIDYVHFFLGPMIIFLALLFRRWPGRRSRSSTRTTASTQNSREHPQPQHQPQQTPEGSSSHTTPPIDEPPPAYSPQGEGFEMKAMTRQGPRTDVNAALQNDRTRDFVESPRIEEGRPPEVDDNANPPPYQADRQNSSRSPRTGFPLDLHALCNQLLVCILLMGSTIILYLGIGYLIFLIPAQDFDRERQNGYFFRNTESRETLWHDVKVIHIAWGLVGVFGAFILSLFMHSSEARGTGRAKLRNYWAKLFRNGNVSEAFFAALIGSTILMLVYDLLISHILIGWLAGDKHGLREFEGDKHAVRYWFYFAFTLLPMLSS
ncbi:hypothetical protein V8F20_010854 [Naviculisporaceae sp. PSN 640]